MPDSDVPSCGVSARLARVFTDLRTACESDDTTLLQWANLLRVIPDGGLPIARLAVEARISKRAARSWLNLRAPGWLHVTATTVSLTEFGRRARDAAAQRVRAGEEAWSARRREAEAAELRSALIALVSQFELELPHYPMVYGPADVRALGGSAVQARTGPPRIPAHGSDWTPVLRTDPDSATRLPLCTVLSQAVMAYTIDYEERTGCALSIGDGIARSMPDGRLSLKESPAALGITGTGRSGLERHGIVRVCGGDVILTDRGREIRDHHAPVLAEVDDAFRQRFGEDVIDRLESALAGIDANLPANVPDVIVVRYQAGVVFADVSRSAYRAIAAIGRRTQPQNAIPGIKDPPNLPG